MQDTVENGDIPNCLTEEYLDLFTYLKKIEDKQKAQKARGLNDYNMVNVVRKAHYEVGMHSNVIYSLLDPDGLHYQGDLFLSLFIEHVLKPGENFLESNKSFGDIISVQAEERTTEKRRVDFTIKSSNYYIWLSTLLHL